VLEEDALRGEAVDALIAIGPSAAPTVANRLQALLTSGTAPRARLECIRVLERLGVASAEVVKTLTNALRDPVEENRQAALQAGKKLTGVSN
jgi:HEAT repeat protein